MCYELLPHMDAVTVAFVQGYVTYSLPWPVTACYRKMGSWYKPVNGPAGPILDSFTILSGQYCPVGSFLADTRQIDFVS